MKIYYELDKKQKDVIYFGEWAKDESTIFSEGNFLSFPSFGQWMKLFLSTKFLLTNWSEINFGKYPDLGENWSSCKWGIKKSITTAKSWFDCEAYE